MAKELPAQPNISHLRRQARDLQRTAISGDPDTIARIRESHPTPPSSFAAFALRDAQLTLAREYGYDSWHDLSTAVGELMVEVRDLDRWFGVELNNEVWTRIDTNAVTPDAPELDKEHILYSAFASALHWRNAGGTTANIARGEHLISRAAVVAGRYQLALEHATRCLELVESEPGVMEDWDLAFALEALARAQAATGDTDTALVTLKRARAVCAEVSDPEDREIVEAELVREPWFGLV